MKPRARRVTITAAVLGAGVLALLVVAHWGTVRDHVEAWHFQLTKQTKTIAPNPALGQTRPFVVIEDDSFFSFALEDCLLALATWSGQSVVLDSTEGYAHPVVRMHEEGFSSVGDTFTYRGVPWTGKSVGAMFEMLQASGFRVLEQCFPRRAYVVIRDEQAPQELEEPAPALAPEGGELEEVAPKDPPQDSAPAE